MIKSLLIFLFILGIEYELEGQKIFMTSGNAFVLPSNAIASQFIKTDSGFVALFQNQKLTGSYQFFLVFLDKELNFQYKYELENASTEFYNNIDFQYDTLRVFSAKSIILNNKNVVEYGYRIYNYKQRKINPAYKKLALREALPSLNYAIPENAINPYQYHLVKLKGVYHLYYFQKKRVKSIDYTYICVKIFDEYFNYLNYFQKEITPFENLAISNIFFDDYQSGMDLKINDKNNRNVFLFYHVRTSDTLWISEISTKKYFNKHLLLNKNQSLGILGSEKPEYAYFFNSNNLKDSLLLESVFGSQNYEYFFQYFDKYLGYFPYISKYPFFSIHNLYVTNLESKKSIMLPYYISTSIDYEIYLYPVFWNGLCLIAGKLNTKNYFEPNENPIYTFWNYEQQNIAKEFYFNQPFSLILQRPFLKNPNGAYFLGKNKDKFMFYKVEIHN